MVLFEYFWRSQTKYPFFSYPLSSTLPLPLSREKEVTSLTFDKASHSRHRSLPHSSFHFRATSASHPTTTTYLMLIMKSMSCFSFSSLQHLTFFLFLFFFFLFPNRVMTMVGKWPHSVSFLDARSNSVLSILINTNILYENPKLKANTFDSS